MSNTDAGSIRVSENPEDYGYVIPGAILLDGLFHSFCLGFVLALGVKYREEYKEDRMRKRLFVLAVVALSFLQTVVEDYKLWITAISGLPWAGSPFVWTDFCINGVICSMCEAFYIRRCWKMTGKRPLALYPMAILWISGVAGQFYVTITLALELRNFTIGHVLNNHAEELFRYTVIVFSYWLLACTILDITVATILVTCLVKSKTGLDSSDTVINRVILMTLETALLPSISMVVAVAILHGAPNPGENDDLVLFFVFIAAKLYTIGLLRTLNARARLRQRIDSTDLGRTSLGKWTWDQNPPHERRDRASDVGTTSRSNKAHCQQLAPETVSETLRGSMESVTQTFREAVAPNEIVEVQRSGPSGGQHVHFGSPLLDQYEHGYTRLRVSSIHKARPQGVEAGCQTKVEK